MCNCSSNFRCSTKKKDTHSLFRVAELMARGDMPPQAIEAIKLGRMTALRKESGGVRGIVSGEVMRRLTARTIAQQVGPAVKAGTAPFRYAQRGRAASALDTLCKLYVSLIQKPQLLLSTESAHMTQSRARAMLFGLQRVEGSSACVPFVHMFCSCPSSHLLEGDSGVVHAIQQGEGGEQGDVLMFLLFCVGQHAALEEVQARLRPNERLFAYLDDVFVFSKLDRVGAICTALQGPRTCNQAGQEARCV